MRQILDGSEPILLVSHDADDHGWQFIGTSDASETDSRLVAMEEMVKCDPTILEIANLPPGWQAIRTEVGGAWKRSLCPENPEPAPGAPDSPQPTAETPESPETDNPFFPPLQDDAYLPPPAAEPSETPAQATPTLAAPSELADTVAATEPVHSPVESKPGPKPGGISILFVGVILIIAAAAILALYIQNRGLHTQLDQAKKQAAQLRTQLDHLAITSGPGSNELLVVSAIYGSGSHFNDVTDRVNELLHQPGTEFYAKPDWLHADPTPGWNKELTIVYKSGGQRHFFTAGEGGKVSAAILLDEAKK